MPSSEVSPSQLPELIVGIGASAGGLRALEAFFSALPSNTGCAYVVVQHLSPDFKSLMDDLLARRTRMPIRHAEDGSVLERDVVYLIPPRKVLTVRDNQLQVGERPTGRSGDLPINVFFSSLAIHGKRAVGIILSGTGTDGSEGLLALSAAGAFTLVQSPESAEFDGMPRSAIATRAADCVLPPEKMPEMLLAYLENPAEPPNVHYSDATQGPSVQGEFSTIFRLIHRDHGLDFSLYKNATVERRVHRRMSFLDLRNPEEYALRLDQDPAERDALYKDLLIGVTEFFRDPKFFEILRADYLPSLLSRADHNEFRAWIAGCATGEEAYSFAMLFDEVARESGFGGRISVFATDAHRTSLESAASGLYERPRLEHVGAERLNRYFREEKNGLMRIGPELRQRIVFAPHNLLVDPPFTRLDFISCRNLLIYLEPAAQERVLSLFHYALRRGGVLFLGPSEGLGRLEEEFECLDSKAKIYRKMKESRLPLEIRSTPTRAAASTPAPPSSGHIQMSRPLIRAYDFLLRKYAPSGFVVTEEGSILHYLGNAGQFLNIPEGRMQDNLLSRTSGDLHLALAILLPRAQRSGAPAISRGVRATRSDGVIQVVDLHVEPVPDDKSGGLLLSVTLVPPPTEAPPPKSPAETGNREPFEADAAKARRIDDLEQELQTTKENLQATVEELQTANEELQATNEEMLAANEELQSTNEELHSVNEELYTVNAEFERKNLDLKQLAEDLDNLLSSLEIGILFLDRDLRIRKFNPAIERFFRLLPQDIGRPIAHITYQLEAQDAMLAEVARVLATGQPSRREVRSRDGTWLLKRILPFFSTHRSIEGVVLTFTDITEVKVMQDRFDLAIEASRIVWWDWDVPSDRLQTHTLGWCILGYSIDCLQASGTGWLALVHPEDVGGVKDSLDRALRNETPSWDCEHRFRTRDGGWLWVTNKGRVTERDPHGRPLRMVGTTQDIDARKSAEVALARDLELLARLPDAIISTDDSGMVTYWNRAAEQLYGWSAAERIGRPLADRFPPHLLGDLPELLAGATSSDDAVAEVEDFRRDGSRVWVDARCHKLSDSTGRNYGRIFIARDITEKRRQEEERGRMEHQLAQSQKMETLGTLAGGIAHDFNNLLTAILGYAEVAGSQLDTRHPAQTSLEMVRGAGQRAATLVRRILAFSRKHETQSQPTVLSQLVLESLPIVRASLPATIEIRTEIGAAGQSVLCDATQIQQVLLNLCANAGYAMRQSGGALIVRTTSVELQTSLPTSSGLLKPGSYLTLAVIDAGPGVPEPMLARIFEPFFTTKPPGEGTGLGLSIVHTIVTRHGGAVQVSQTPGGGATFTVYLPETLATTPPPQITNKPRRGAGERIAIVDDEPSIAELSRRTLEHHGYSAESFDSARSFLDAQAKNPDHFQALITDQTMPRMTGIELMRALREAGSPIPVLLVSGFARALSADELAQLAPASFLPKPYELDELVGTLANLLDQSRSDVKLTPS